MNISGPDVNIGRESFDAVLFDLDGVVTRTAEVHAASWKQLFDGYLQQISRNSEWKPFDIEHDYTRYVDGRPRYEGVKSFLASRNIDLPYGSPADPPERETICGLGNRKNLFFNRQIEKDGVSVYGASLDLIRLLRKKGFKTAVVTSSKNCVTILKAANIENLFDVRVDGIHIANEKLHGKPEPDIFLKAAKALGTTPGRSVVFEDAESGVSAGKKGKFGLVIGVDRTGNSDRLLEKGAHQVVTDLSQITVDGDRPFPALPVATLPSAMESFHEISARLKERKIFVALDYDGTLTPIVDRPEDAIISREMRRKVNDLAGVCTLVVISGRDLKDVRDLVGIDSLIYAGSHGFDISGPQGQNMSFRQGDEFLPLLDKAETGIRNLLENIPGTSVERKKYSIAVHYRLAAEKNVPRVETIVDDSLAQHEGLVKGSGKKVFELRPGIDWDKGKALLWIMNALEFNPQTTAPVYIGDDTTDEDAFAVIGEHGTGIVVSEGKAGESTAARFTLADTEEVGVFLQRLTSWISEGENI
jgi:alpha,alpha-trehalase